MYSRKRIAEEKEAETKSNTGVRIPLCLSILFSSTRKDVIGSLFHPVLKKYLTTTSTAPQGTPTLALWLGSGACFCRHSPLFPLAALQQASERSLREHELDETKHENAFQECTYCIPDVNKQ